MKFLSGSVVVLVIGLIALLAIGFIVFLSWGKLFVTTQGIDTSQVNTYTKAIDSASKLNQQVDNLRNQIPK